MNPQLATLVALLAFTAETIAQSFASAWQGQPDRIWIGADYWANRLQDWELRNGRVECVRANLPERTLHLATWRIEQLKRGMVATVWTGRAAADAGADATATPATAFAAILVGAGSADLDPRAACLVQSAPGPDGGYLCGVDGSGTLFVREHLARADRRERSMPLPGGAGVLRDVRIELGVTVGRRRSRLEGKAVAKDGTVLGSVGLDDVPNEDLLGNLALVSHGGDDKEGVRFWFADWNAEGRMLAHHPERGLGPILAAFHTLSRGTLKMSAVMLPVGGAEGGQVCLDFERDGSWQQAAVAHFAAPDYTALFKIADWKGDARVPYRLRYDDQVYGGAIRPEPNRPEVRLAALSCVHQVRHGLGRAGYPWNTSALWFPHADLCQHLEQQDPDLLFFAGDQIYEGASPTPPSRGADAGLDYLYKWYLFCWAFREVARDRPTIVIPDDHDVFQGNLWGAGGRKTDRDNKGGYVMPADWVRMVERTQTSHLPDAVDPAPVEQDIGVYFTSLRYGRVDFAILEDRKFKSGPNGLVDHHGPRPDHINDPDFDIATADVPGAVLLGERQLRFLDRWARDWDGVAMKAVLSQTVFANVATHHGGRQDFLIADLDSNGWPQTGRNKALAAIRRAFAPMICGDQHLATLVHHGIDDWRDAGYSFCVPAMANFYPRSWRPPEPGLNHVEGMPEVTGDYFDGFHNKVTVLATTNESGSHGREPLDLHDHNPGHGLVVFDTAARTIRFECWPRYAVPGVDAQYEGWPVTVAQMDNYGRRAMARLPRLVVSGCDEPVLVVEDQRGELVYAIRLPQTEFRPPVFGPGRYRVTLSDGTGDPHRTVVRELEPTNDPDLAVGFDLSR
ncbi:MAG: alkaline phosphatase D family protein [Planctomycetes bacterium]|nr:alkaline phosphatase D family protein [Planctomycetota bacterium]